MSDVNLEKIAANMLIGAVKSVARHNKRAAELLGKVTNWTKEIKEHNSFLDDLINIISPVISLAHSFLAKLFPSYMNIIDWIFNLLKDVSTGIMDSNVTDTSVSNTSVTA